MSRRIVVASILLAGLTVFGCSETRDPTAPTPTPNPDLVGTLTGGSDSELAKCPMTQYDSTSATIGRLGGIIASQGNFFVVPPGALTREVRISMVVPRDNIRSVRFYPEGLKFNVLIRPRLVMRFVGCTPSTNLLPRIHYITEKKQFISQVKTLLQGVVEVTGEIEHFSRYAIAW